jgi:hypothetical protein
MKHLELHCIAGFKLCRKCLQKLLCDKSDGPNSSSGSGELRDIERMNESLLAIGKSPMRRRGPSNSTISMERGKGAPVLFLN